MFNTLMNSVWNDAETGWLVNNSHAETAEETESSINTGEDVYPYNDLEAFMAGETTADNLYFTPRDNSAKTAGNKLALQKSGITVADITNELSKTIDIAAIRQFMIRFNSENPVQSYSVDSSGSPAVDSVFTEAVHLFQMANYISPAEHDGLLGQSTLETLGFYEHQLKNYLNGAGLYGQKVLNANSSKVTAETSQEFTASNWFRYIVKPSFLGVRIHDGVHLLLLRKLREAENWLLSQTQYKGMTRAELGKALGFNKDSRLSAARLSSENQAMHGFGLAIDINVPGNPWIGAGWIRYDNVFLLERKEMIKDLRTAAGDNTLPGATVFEYLNSIALSAGNDTLRAYNILRQRNDEFISFIRNNPSRLSYWKNSQTFGGRNPLSGFLNLNRDLVSALRQIAGLAWGAIDFGPNASGDVMHFDYRTIGLGRILCSYISGWVPKSGNHPAIESESYGDAGEYELHEAIEEGTWDEVQSESEFTEFIE